MFHQSLVIEILTKEAHHFIPLMKKQRSNTYVVTSITSIIYLPVISVCYLSGGDAVVPQSGAAPADVVQFGRGHLGHRMHAQRGQNYGTSSIFGPAIYRRVFSPYHSSPSSLATFRAVVARAKNPEKFQR